jgi:glycosidase
VLYFQQGTPFIYQGQEIGMTNPGFTELSDYQDIETHRIYRLGRRLGLSHKRMMKKIMYMSRDNARTPMQWDDSENAGFSKGKPWIKVNSDYKTVNVKKSLADPKSIFYFYQKIIALRKQLTIIVEGTFKELLPKHKYIYCYLREYEGKKLLVVGNLSDKTLELPIPKDIDITKGKLILQNYPEISPMLQAYEARVYLFE